MPSCAPVRPDPTLVDGDHSRHRELTELLAEAAVGDRSAWEELVDRFEGFLLHIARRYGLPPDEAADVVQDTWLQLMANAHRIRNADSLPGWLKTTATRKSWEATRRRRREIPTADCGAALSEVFDLEDRLDAITHLRHLRQAVGMLPPRERALMELLLEPDSPSYQQISRRLGMPVGAIGPVRQRALRRLRALLEEPKPAAAFRASA